MARQLFAFLLLLLALLNLGGKYAYGTHAVLLSTAHSEQEAEQDKSEGMKGLTVLENQEQAIAPVLFASPEKAFVFLFQVFEGFSAHLDFSLPPLQDFEDAIFECLVSCQIPKNAP